MKLISAFIIDDEQDSVNLLQLQLQQYCPQIGSIETSTSATAAVLHILQNDPEIIFLDIEMPEMNGFQLLEKIMPLKAAVIFVTAYNAYAIKAFRYNAIDYLLKPIQTNSLVEAVEKALKNFAPNTMQLGNMQRQLNGEVINKIAVATKVGIEFIDFDDIAYVEASGNYSKFFMMDGSTFVISKTLKNIQDLLEENTFFRIHRQYMVNLNWVKYFDRNDCTITMKNKAELPVAQIQKDKFMAKFNII
jgi:two-component system, LytTR family, response regulator